MRVNVYAEEMTDRIEIIEKTVEGHSFTALRFYLELPCTIPAKDGGDQTMRGPFMHRPGDDDSAAVTFWGKQDLQPLLAKGMHELNKHFAKRHHPVTVIPVTLADLRAVMTEWIENDRNGKTRTDAERNALPIEQVAGESADWLWNTLNVNAQAKPEADLFDPETNASGLKDGQVLLLVGPPGCGKSTKAREFAMRRGGNYRQISAKDFENMHVCRGVF